MSLPWVERLYGPRPFEPPAASKALVRYVPFGNPDPKGDKYIRRFNRWDNREEQLKNEKDWDKNYCYGIYSLPNNVLFWSAKMALDTDGAIGPDIKRDDKSHQDSTSLQFKRSASHGKNAEQSIDSRVVPYLVAPGLDVARDEKTGNIIEKEAYENSGDDFLRDFNLSLGMLGVVIFGDKITGALFADTGRPMKIGEASIRVHQLLRKAPRPWKDASHERLKDSGEDKGVLYFVFRDILFDINKYGPTEQVRMETEIQSAARAAWNRLYGNSWK